VPRDGGGSSSADVRFQSEVLGPHHDLGSFASGVVSLDDWLRSAAPHASAMNTGRTFVWHSGGDVVVAYFTLAAHLVRRDRVAKKVGRGSPDDIPSVLLARLALSQEGHGDGLGGELLWDALSRAVAASTIAAARLVVVEALDENAARFYEHHGFVAAPDRPFVLVQKVSDIAVALGS